MVQKFVRTSYYACEAGLVHCGRRVAVVCTYDSLEAYSAVKRVFFALPGMTGRELYRA